MDKCNALHLASNSTKISVNSQLHSHSQLAKGVLFIYHILVSDT